jgi:hypothetical protein
MRTARTVLLCCAVVACDDGETRDCEPGASRDRVNACGVCATGAQQELCGDAGTWEPVRCVDPIDWDGDGWANESCDDLPGGCCTTRRDCNDQDPDVHAATFDCIWRGAPERPDEEACTTSCGTSGTRTCAPLCSWNACAAAESCNGVYDDCDGETDEVSGGCP